METMSEERATQLADVLVINWLIDFPAAKRLSQKAIESLVNRIRDELMDDDQ